MITLQYISSKGEIVDLITENGLVRMSDACFHSWRYKFDTTERQFGVTVNKPKKDPSEYEATLFIFGNGNETKQRLNEMQDIFESDIILNQCGKIIWDGWSINCFISESKTEPSEDSFGVTKKINIYCPESFWVKEVGRAFETTSGQQSSDGLNFPFNFPFNFGSGSSNSVLWNTGIRIPSDFIMTIYGNSNTVSNPTVNINNYEYKIFTNVNEGQLVTINSKTNEVLKHLTNGTIENIFNSRQFTPSVFNKIPGGELLVNWSGAFTFSITLFEQRSEPRWTLS